MTAFVQPRTTFGSVKSPFIMPRSQKPLSGRPPKSTETMTERVSAFSVTPSFDRLYKEEVRKSGLEAAEFNRQALEFYIANKNKAMAETNSFKGHFLTKAPAGPIEEAIDMAGEFTISEDTADELEVRDGDLFVRAIGESMEEAHIIDGALLVMRPVGNKNPRRGEIVLAEVIVSEHEHYGTIKHWNPGSPDYLTDGKGERIDLPEGAQLVPVATLRGSIAAMSSSRS